MTDHQLILFSLFGAIFFLLLWGRIRYDLVAFSALVIGVLTGVVPSSDAFSGFGHPATIIVALVLVVSAGLVRSGAVYLITKIFIDASRSLSMHIGFMGVIGAVMSAFMNNVAALALLLPVDLQTAKKAKRAAALSLMPLSFATILGGMATLVGTPPNIIISSFREKALGSPFQMFDFAPVGGIVALAGIVVNNNIVLIDTYQELAGKMPKIEAIIRTAEQRIRPVLLTTITTMAGLAPMMFGLSLDFFNGGYSIDSPTALWWKQLATAVVFGLGTATVLTLVFTPALLALRVWLVTYAIWLAKALVVLGAPKKAKAFQGSRVIFFLSPLGFIIELIEMKK